jgi:hypothetical protein
MLGSSMPPVVCRRSLIYVFFCLRIGLSNTYCVAVFRYVCLPVVSCVPYVASLDCLFLIVPLGFSDVYFLQSNGLFDTTLWDKVHQLCAGRWFSPDNPVSSTNEADHH